MSMTGTAMRVSFTIGVLVLMGGCATAPRAIDRSNHIILVGHGVPAKDYPKARLREFFRMSPHDHAGDQAPHGHEASKRDLREKEIRQWTRNPVNDPYKYGVEAIAKRIESRTGHDVLIAFNEFCAPTVGQAIDEAVSRGARRVMVVPTMLTPGGGHSEEDIPARIAVAQRKHPGVEMIYAWPFDADHIAATLAEQLERFGLDQD